MSDTDPTVEPTDGQERSEHEPELAEQLVERAEG